MAKTVFELLVERLRQTGKLTSVPWLKRVEGERDPETGQPTITWEEATAEVIIVPDRVSPVEWPPGMTRDEFMRVYTVEEIQHLDRLEYQGFEWEVQPPQDVFQGETFVYRFFTIKKLELKQD